MFSLRHHSLLSWVCLFLLCRLPLLGYAFLGSVIPFSCASCSVTPFYCEYASLCSRGYASLCFVTLFSCEYASLCSVTPSSPGYTSLCLPSHRALLDAEAMEELFTQWSWRVCCHNSRYVLLGSSSNFDVPRRNNGKYQHSCARSWEGSHGSSEAVGLTGLSHRAIVGIRATIATSEEFQQVLLGKGICSRPLQEKLAGIFSKIVAASWRAFYCFRHCFSNRIFSKRPDTKRFPRSVALTRHLAVLTPW